MRTRTGFGWLAVLPLCGLAAGATLAGATLAGCGEEEEIEDLGQVTDGKGDIPEIRDKPITLKPKTASGRASQKTFSVTSEVDFRVELEYASTAQTRLTVTADDGTRVGQSAKGVDPALDIDALEGNHLYKIKIEHWGTATLSAKLSVLAAEAVPADVLAAAEANLARVAKEIDYWHLDEYDLSGSIQKRFMTAVQLEYADHPDQLAARMSALASMVFFAAPEIQPPPSGHVTPFHGLDEAQFDQLVGIEDQVWSQLVADNGGSLVGVRPFSVCETRYIIEKFVRPRTAYTTFTSYKSGYTTFAATCPAKDKAEWYNFRGLGHLRPSWIESNIMDRFLRRMLSRCDAPIDPAWTDACDAFAADRRGYRQGGNRQLASRLLMYDAATQETTLEDTNAALALVEDRDGDGVGEFFREGPTHLTNGTAIDLIIESTGEFTGSLKYRKPTGTLVTVKPQDLVAETAVVDDFDRGLLGEPDFGLMALFPESTGCTGATLSPESCPLLKRFYVLIDRHEYFYRTYSSLSPDRASLSSQPSPLVACSITLGAAHAWDTAGIPAGGRAGFIFLMRIPFAQILAGSDKSVSTLSPGPDVLSVQDLYAGRGTLDMDKVWLDIASLSNNLYEHEHEISKFGAVPAEQIEGILVIRRPAAMP